MEIKFKEYHSPEIQQLDEDLTLLQDNIKGNYEPKANRRFTERRSTDKRPDMERRGNIVYLNSKLNYKPHEKIQYTIDSIRRNLQQVNDLIFDALENLEEYPELGDFIQNSNNNVYRWVQPVQNIIDFSENQVALSVIHNSLEGVDIGFKNILSMAREQYQTILSRPQELKGMNDYHYHFRDMVRTRNGESPCCEELHEGEKLNKWQRMGMRLLSFIPSFRDKLRMMELIEDKQQKFELEHEKFINEHAKFLTEHQRFKDEHKKLVALAHKAGKAEIAVDVLHNLGNALNTINVGVGVMKEKMDSFDKPSQFLGKISDELFTSISSLKEGGEINLDRVLQLVSALSSVIKKYDTIKASGLAELMDVEKMIVELKTIVGEQQKVAVSEGMCEKLNFKEVVVEKLEISCRELNLNTGEIEVEMQEDTPCALGESTKLDRIIHTLLNRCSNIRAKLPEDVRNENPIKICVGCIEDDSPKVNIKIWDPLSEKPREIDIAESHRIFLQGYQDEITPLNMFHNNANAMAEMGGCISAEFGEDKGMGINLQFLPVAMSEPQAISAWEADPETLGFHVKIITKL